MRTFLLASLFIALPLSSQGVKVANLTLAWTESGMRVALLRERISNEKCATQAAYLAACREVVKVAKRYVDFGKVDFGEDDFDAFLNKVETFDYTKVSRPKEQIWGLMYNAFLRSFDAHGALVPASTFKALLHKESGARYGTGLRLSFTAAGVFVRDVTRFSPAGRQGLRVHDKILSVNGRPMGVGVAAYENRDLLSGSPGDTLKLVIERGTRKLAKSIKIGVVAERNVQTEVFAVGKTQYLVVRLLEFGKGSCDELKEEIQQVKAKYQGIILDLRENPGGIVEESVCIAALFVGRKNIVGQKKVAISIPIDVDYQPPNDDGIVWTAGDREAEFAKSPLTVLMSANSASSSEIVAGALQDYKAAWIVGDRSYGKGTVQSVLELRNQENFRIVFTTALFYRPNGASNQLVGVTPNFLVPARRQLLATEQSYLREQDLALNAIQPPEGDLGGWRETRPEVEALRRCVENSNSDLKVSEALMKKRNTEDYQLAYALALNSCLAKSRSNLSKHNR